MSTVLSKEVINKKNTHELGVRIKKNWAKFNLKSFDAEIAKSLSSQGLGERIQQVRKSLYNHLPKDYKTSLGIILESLPGILRKDAFDNKLDLSSQNGFLMISVTSFVARYGIDEFEVSMSALKEMTKRFSAEGSIRYFILKYPEKTLEVFSRWVTDESPHVRRLVSESTRPRLPMTMALPIFKKNPKLIIPFLETLKDDSELFIRRSVANNLNDVSKDNPKVVTKLLRKWNRVKSPERQWVIKHALRTLEKQGGFDALEILGFSPNPRVKVERFKLKKKNIKLGETLELELDLISSSRLSQNLLIDFVIHHMKANGKQSPKVFKWCKKEIAKSAPLILIKKHSIKEISTRKYYSGRHRIQIQINGKIMAESSFNLRL